MANLAQALGILTLAVGVLAYVGAVAGVFFAAATPPLDVGALSVLGTCLVGGLVALALGRQPVA